MFITVVWSEPGVMKYYSKMAKQPTSEEKGSLLDVLYPSPRCHPGLLSPSLPSSQPIVLVYSLHHMHFA
jgi:hypothetical protein